ncbi:hypothetical protein [Streptomyces sp. NPDC047886]|uniref:hypothetical protein n=1 Tax=Streptomyces sp. NPDC047886 TaxID=3365490 RepID=UPI00371011E7
MPRWIVLAVPVDGVAEIDREARTVAELEGSTEDAEAALLQAVNAFEHRLRKVRRRQIFKCSNQSYYVRLHGRLATYGFLMQLAELVHDSAPGPAAAS